jgi:hypothetical protein
MDGDLDSFRDMTSSLFIRMIIESFARAQMTAEYGENFAVLR